MIDLVITAVVFLVIGMLLGSSSRGDIEVPPVVITKKPINTQLTEQQEITIANDESKPLKYVSRDELHKIMGDADFFSLSYRPQIKVGDQDVTIEGVLYNERITRNKIIN